MSSSLPPVTAGTIYHNALGLPPIEAFATLFGDGVTDDSVAIKAAHDAAYAAGVREVYCARRYYAPSAYNLGNVIFRGPGSLSGTYLKQVFPLSLRPAQMPGGGIVGSRDLKVSGGSLTPTVVIWGDSTGTYGANHISTAELLWLELEERLTKANPGRKFNFVNRSIGGSAMSNYNMTGTQLIAAGLTLPSWFSIQASAWSGFVANQAPDLVIINWGQNSASSTSAYEALYGPIAYLLTLPKVPDIWLVTNAPRGMQADVGAAMVQAQEDHFFAAGGIRSAAEFGGYGLIDQHRAACMARDGIDVCSQQMTQIIGPNSTPSSSTLTLPATLPLTQQDFDLTFTIDNTGGAAFTTGSGKYDLLLSPQSGNTLRIGASGGYVTLTGFIGGGGTTWLASLPPPFNVIAMPSAVVTIEVSIKNSWMGVYVQGNTVYEGPFAKNGGQFQPTFVLATGSGASSITVTQFVSSAPQRVAPSLTDAEMYGTPPYYFQGGEGTVHPASPYYETVWKPLLDAQDFRCYGRPTQPITAAGAINPDCDLIQLTGPATGTYAITLAAPRPQDKGNTLAIEMTATTGSNTVTMALTNVSGGTASTTCTWSAANQRLILIALGSTWEVIKQDGVTLS
jgi:hypothetical protein